MHRFSSVNLSLVLTISHVFFKQKNYDKNLFTKYLFLENNFKRYF